MSKRSLTRPASAGREIIALLAIAFVLMRFGLGFGQALAAEAVPDSDRPDILQLAMQICSPDGTGAKAAGPEGDEPAVPDLACPYCPACFHAVGAMAVLSPEAAFPVPGRTADVVDWQVTSTATPSEAGRSSFRSRAPPFPI